MILKSNKGWKRPDSERALSILYQDKLFVMFFFVGSFYIVTYLEHFTHCSTEGEKETSALLLCLNFSPLTRDNLPAAIY